MKSSFLKSLAIFSLLFLTSAKAAEKTSPKATDNPPKASSPANAGEKVGPGDRLVYSVAEDPAGGSVSSEVLVDSKLNVRFPVSRGFSEEVVVNAEDKTLTQIQKELKEKLDARYYQNATVSVSIGAQALQPGKITITGPIRNNFVQLLPGERKKLLETILQAGPSEFANLKKVKLMRIDPNGGKTKEEIINVEAIKKDPTKDVFVKDGDRLDIPEKNILFQ
jgi:protein involved in polysaccharide export with SLBB domain